MSIKENIAHITQLKNEAADAGQEGKQQGKDLQKGQRQ